MLVEFDKISDDSRLWIYASDKKLTIDQESYILKYIFNYLKDWKSHSSHLKSAATILENYFIVVALDESYEPASGCSIDKIYNLIYDLEKDLKISLLNRLNVFCNINDTIVCIPTSQLSDNVSSDTLFYDLTVTNKSDLSAFLKPIKNGWCNRLIKTID